MRSALKYYVLLAIFGRTPGDTVTEVWLENGTDCLLENGTVIFTE